MNYNSNIPSPVQLVEMKTRLQTFRCEHILRCIGMSSSWDFSKTSSNATPYHTKNPPSPPARPAPRYRPCGAGQGHPPPIAGVPLRADQSPGRSVTGHYPSIHNPERVLYPAPGGLRPLQGMNTHSVDDRRNRSIHCVRHHPLDCVRG